MSFLWCRLWNDMPIDPKWRTIARASGQRIGDVIAVFVFLMANASANACERGRTHNWNSEDVANAIDIQPDEVKAINNEFRKGAFAVTKAFRDAVIGNYNNHAPVISVQI